MLLQLIAAIAPNASAPPRLRQYSLKLLVAFLRRHRSAAQVRLPEVVELVVHSLDPRQGAARGAVAATATLCLKIMLQLFPNTDFYQVCGYFPSSTTQEGPLPSLFLPLFCCSEQKSQHFALGSTDHSVIVFDLRTACKWRVFKGHTGPVTTVAFAPTGELLCSYSNDDRTVRIWQVGFNALRCGVAERDDALIMMGSFLSECKLWVI